ncbi:hypothetical protein [Shewanella phaeophyticola]|uniref:Uncharacterized protein n=1 Tax=Shewanella phaeophyticola TaxID=2978345 RepID=A0ABT2NZV8_9GAMM|nr:hypothetical protein [Shewanella sp. KJ10-1]MCT8985933.1 hypothetical protein [Shewanella sp. KJ10-1]
MQGSKDVLDLLTKLKDTRLNLAIFLVSNLVLVLINQKLITLNSVSETVLQGLVFVTSIRLVYAVIGAIIDFFNNKKFIKNKEAETALKLEQDKMAITQAREKMLFNFRELDVFQLYIIQELKRQNHIRIPKGAPLFTLKNMNIIYTPAVSDKTETASLTNKASELLNEAVWDEFDDLKYGAAKRFFVGLQPEEVKCFIEFLANDNIKTTNSYRGSTSYYDSYYVFKKYSDTTLFSQPQRGTEYKIDSIAKDVIFSIYGEQPEAVNG